MRYAEVVPIDRNDAMQALEGDNPWQIREALLRSAFHDPDWRWVQEQCIRFASHSDSSVRYMAVLCLGHLGRIHRILDLDKVVPLLLRLTDDSAITGTVEEVIEDIEMFVPKGRRTIGRFKEKG